MKNKILIVGALGAVGRCALEHFDSLSDWEVVGASRRRPDFPTRAEWVSVDLRDRGDCMAKLAELKGVTHIAYTAVYEKPDVTRGWSEMEHVKVNLEMLQNLVEPVEAASPGLRHVTLMQGTKAYGAISIRSACRRAKAIRATCRRISTTTSRTGWPSGSAARAGRGRCCGRSWSAGIAIGSPSTSSPPSG